MATVVSSSDAKARFGALIRLAKDEQIVIEVHGEPEAVLISYGEYQLLEELKEIKRRQEALAALRSLRQETVANTNKLTEEEAYRFAGISDSIARKLIEHDQEALHSHFATAASAPAYRFYPDHPGCDLGYQRVDVSCCGQETSPD